MNLHVNTICQTVLELDPNANMWPSSPSNGIAALFRTDPARTGKSISILGRTMCNALPHFPRQIKEIRITGECRRSFSISCSRILKHF